MSWVMQPGEVRHHLQISGGSVASAQALIDAARRQHPSAVLMLELQGKIRVGDHPLKLPSHTVLMFAADAGLVADADAKASSLIYIADAASIAVISIGEKAATLDGGGFDGIGIEVVGGKRILFDRLHIQNCGKAGMDYQGASADAVNGAGSLTRSLLENNGVGLQVKNSAGFICEENVFRHQSGTALEIASKSSVVVRNHFEENAASIICGSADSVITRNVFGDERVLALTLESRGNLLSENVGKGAGQLIRLDGKDQQLFRNHFQQASVAGSGEGGLLLANEGLEVLEARSVRVFDPPTFSRPHQRAQIVPGRGRFDMEMVGGNARKHEAARDLAEVEVALRAARSAHPDDVIVLWLQGEFVSRKPEGLQLPPDVCLILDGRIRADPGTELEPAWKADVPLTQVLRLPEKGYCSISGGTLDAGRQVFHPLNAAGGAVALIESVNLTAGARDGLSTKQRGRAPLFVYRSRVFGNRHRGIWAHVAHRIQIIDNVCTGNGMDGIDIDAYAVGCTALFNVSSGNGRHGIFVEEAVKGSVVVGNELYDNRDSGVHVWNEAVPGNTGGNVIASNICVGNRRGVSVGGRSEEKTAKGNFFYNNLCQENRVNGMWAGNVHAKGNYFSCNQLVDNQGMPVLEAENAFYLTPPLDLVGQGEKDYLRN
ncbi:right-handed parallel beta-helix repeat-containing protein [Kiritimatiellota bacterium B12222]|nr:right-handed parallel beta-helix repeat-containing protein [Kiritimatiellota bacterium B12222]